MAETSASRAALLALRRDRSVIEEGYRFLDEKRVALAHELLRRAGDYAARRAEFLRQAAAAGAALAAAIGRHGLEGLQVYPAPPPEDAILSSREHAFLGVRLVAQAGLALAPPSAPGNGLRTLEGTRCAHQFHALAALAVPLAAEAANLLRLMREFSRTEQRVRAIENIVLPEARAQERGFEMALEELDQEEVVRSRLFAVKR